MAAIAAAVVALGAVVSAYATYQAGQAQAAASEYQGKLARNQAIAARQAAQIAAEDARERHRRVMASQRAALGAAGVMPAEGSPLIVQMESAEQAALEEARIRYGGAVQASGFEAERTLRRFEATQARRAAVLGAGASLLGGAGQAYGIYAGGGSGGSGGRGAYSTNYGYQTYRRGERGY